MPPPGIRGRRCSGWRRDRMLLTKLRNPKYRNDTICVNTRQYHTDETGTCAVQSVDVATLRDACGFEVVGQIDDNVKAVEVRLPKTKEEFMDLALAVGITAADLRALADLLEPIPQPQIMSEPVTTYVAPVPESEKEVFIPPDPETPEDESTEGEETDDESADPFDRAVEETAEDQEEIAEADEGDPEVAVSLELSKPQLLDLGRRKGLPVKPAMRKIEIFNAIMASQG